MIGGASGMFATCCIQPIDFVKVQLQIRGEGVKGARANPFTVLMETVRNYGVRRLYTGLDSALLRQATYTTARMGIYKTLYDWGEGGKSWQISATKANRASSNWCGAWMHLLDYQPPSSQRIYLDATNYRYLTFWVRGDSGGESFNIKICCPIKMFSVLLRMGTYKEVKGRYLGS